MKDCEPVQLPDLRDEVLQGSGARFEQVLAETSGKFRAGRLDEVKSDLIAAQSILSGTETDLRVLDALGAVGAPMKMQRELVLGEEVLVSSGTSVVEDDRLGNIKEYVIPELNDNQYTIGIAAFTVDESGQEFKYKTFRALAEAAFPRQFKSLKDRNAPKAVWKEFYEVGERAIETQTELILKSVAQVEDHPSEAIPPRLLEVYDLIASQPEFQVLPEEDLVRVAKRELSMGELQAKLRTFLTSPVK